MEIWPAIDLRHGKPVRLRQGDYDQQTTFGDDPVEFAIKWKELGAKRLHLVDLDAARGDDPTANRDAVRRIVAETGLPCQMGGGVRDEAAIESLLALGLARLVVGSAALKRPDWFASMCDANPGKLAAGIDARDGMVATDGWLETSTTPAVELAQDLRKKTPNIAAIIYTDIARDGMMSGPNFDGLQQMADATDIPLVASGGVTHYDDVSKLVEMGMPAAIVGRSIYDGVMQLDQVIEIAGDR
ncbi:1-(5-phosphoribosyl)-5-[(5-phosphoribosylamino)methylideneamino]imidazole-4-carboxamide isomerase [Roseiconus lacunae]|uniref:1-(5-phosphoribosyl)-5-[(5-phosphoribosylamino)methylideneamino] imidazole-4-carboxamide isomerase n=1 Tax=Roseiconus lacunae TaxID=2605694 RepID=A0ABT7PPJ8_9BACT|nr:1-(5-phosphoribosyl)-5-[(5-phosphoribosylamino)methylideneamino]imidazole-4-carboxamide isomerase [Roseiconus lacunae]MCD0463034.1 1-(5-phosphoribosyl)-5-[(5-phosphoribosylamino)methylideneamino]imidazole-4-carboxamide isomerase [Roseiconus lacunae]MDM4018435.1 1-(5-phosphoribosyl)-5-[(5-phosphoribosylamino)methylideneamino]imidazole-4-carboxamide isomerase [Roseiconus lacunae]WRQ49141.1 1-(5-phosphoribosyl)-5-[(5-phosphoribosylamino)methylideneamino]imidazole-4-carboxamide isomerase [Stieler